MIPIQVVPDYYYLLLLPEKKVPNIITPYNITITIIIIIITVLTIC